MPNSTTSLSVDTTSAASLGSSSKDGGAATLAASGGSKGAKQTFFSFDRVFGPNDGQTDVYTVVEDLVTKFIDGYNVTVLAYACSQAESSEIADCSCELRYGQTSSGKSYTMGSVLYFPE